MAIMFGCPECGKQLKVGDAMAGKTCKCPGCATLIQIPEESLEAVEEEAVLIEPATAAAGGRSPDAGEARPRRQRDGDREPSPADGEGDRPSPGRKRPREGSNVAVWIGVAGTIAVLLIGGILYGYYFHFTRNPLGEETEFLPDKCQMLKSINLDAVRKSGAYQKAGADGPEYLDRRVREIEPTIPLMGFALDELSRATATRTDQRDLVLILRAKQAVTAEDVKSRLDKAHKKQHAYASNDASRGTFHTYGSANPATADGFFVRGPLIVFAKGEVLQKILDRGGAASVVNTLPEAMSKADFAQGEVHLDIKEGEGGPKKAQADFWIKEFRYDDNQRWEIRRFYCSDSKVAKQLHKEMEAERTKALDGAQDDKKQEFENRKISYWGAVVTQIDPKSAADMVKVPKK